MSSGIVVVDYGIGNVFSVCNALRQIGAEPKLTGDLSTIRSAVASSCPVSARLPMRWKL